MKKYLALVLGVLFTLGFAVSAFAIHAEIPAETQAVVAKGATQIKLGGELRFRGEIKNNTDLDENSGVGENTDTSSAYDGRVRIRVQADVSKNTQGVIHLEGGNGLTGDTYTWGSGSTGTIADSGTATKGTSSFSEGKGYYGFGNGKRGDINILEAWIQHKFTSIPVGIKVGHMPLALGNKLFFDHSKFGDDAIVVFANPTKELHVALLTAKFLEGSSTSADDADAYVGLFVYSPSKGTSISGDVTMVDDKRFGGDLDPNDNGVHLYNYGLRADTAVGGLGIKADLELQGGKVKRETSEEKFKGFAYLVGLSYKVDPVKLSLDYAYGSGDDNSSDDKGKTFVNALGGSQHYTYVYEYRAASATSSNTSSNTGTGLANTQYIRLGVNGDLTKDLNLNVNLYRLRAVKAAVAAGYNYRAGTSKNIGSELDAKITYKLDKNLVYFVEGGYLWTGKFYDSATVAADDAYAVRHGITLNF